MKRIITLFTAVLILTMNVAVCVNARGIDYRKADDSGNYVQYLRKHLSETNVSGMTDADIEDITEYIEYSISMSCRTRLTASDGAVAVTSDKINDGVTECRNMQEEFNDVLAEYGITLTRAVNAVIRMDCANASVDDGILIQVQTGAALPEDIRIKITVGWRGDALTVTSAVLSSSAARKTDFYAYLKKNENKYKLEFRDVGQKVLEEIKSPVGVSLPARNEGMTVYAAYKDVTDNWGGQYNRQDRVIEFETVYSGEYQVREALAEISDIADLDDETKMAVQFMTGRGYFSLDGDKFHPNDPLSRYDYTEALVRMFYAIDNSTVTTFSDVPIWSKYYRFVASSEQDDIVEGYEDGTFRGNGIATLEEVSAMAARTIVDKLGYQYPQNPDKYLKGSGAVNVTDWARDEIALAYRERIFRGGDVQKPITRAEAAVVLHRLFMMMYNTPQEPTIIGERVEKLDSKFFTETNAIIITVIAAVIDLSAIGAVIAVCMKKKKENQ